jgi:hypothetical protein
MVPEIIAAARQVEDRVIGEIEKLIGREKSSANVG